LFRHRSGDDERLRFEFAAVEDARALRRHSGQVESTLFFFDERERASVGARFL
jgi:hypothetical protein